MNKTNTVAGQVPRVARCNTAVVQQDDRELAWSKYEQVPPHARPGKKGEKWVECVTCVWHGIPQNFQNSTPRNFSKQGTKVGPETSVGNVEEKMKSDNAKRAARSNA